MHLLLTISTKNWRKLKLLLFALYLKSAQRRSIPTRRTCRHGSKQTAAFSTFPIWDSVCPAKSPKRTQVCYLSVFCLQKLHDLTLGQSPTDRVVFCSLNVRLIWTRYYIPLLFCCTVTGDISKTLMKMPFRWLFLSPINMFFIWLDFTQRIIASHTGRGANLLSKLHMVALDVVAGDIFSSNWQQNIS